MGRIWEELGYSIIRICCMKKYFQYKKERKIKKKYLKQPSGKTLLK